MYDCNFQQFKIRYFLIYSVLLMVGGFILSFVFAESPFLTDVLQLLLSVGFTGYIIWQTGKHRITYNMASLDGALTKKSWAKYIGLTVATKLYAQLLVVLFGTAFVVLLFNFLQGLFEMAGVLAFEVVAVEPTLFYYVSLFMAICIFAPIWEELFFRGIVLRRMLTKWQAPASIALSSIIFGLYHLNLAQALYATILGAFFGYVYLRTGKMIVPMVLHAVANFVSFLFIVQEGQQSSNGIIEEFMKLDKQLLMNQLLYFGIVSLVLTAVLVGVIIKNYHRVKAIPKLEPVDEVKEEILQNDSTQY